jgi:hypothetical protein
MKIWIKKSRKHLIVEYPEYYKLISEAKIDDYLLYILILIKDMDSLYDYELYKDEFLILRLEIIIKVMNLLYTCGIDIILNNIQNTKYQKLMRVLLDKINFLKIEIEEKEIKEELIETKYYLKKKLQDVYNIIKIKVLNFNMVEDIKDLILEFY